MNSDYFLPFIFVGIVLSGDKRAIRYAHHVHVARSK